MKYKAGDKVRVVSSTSYPTSDTLAMIGEIFQVRSVDKCGLSVWNKDMTASNSFNESDLTPVEKTLYTLEVGDVVVDSNGYEHEVIEVLTQSCMTTYKGVNTNWFTFKQIEEKGWKVKSPQPTPLKMTVSEIAEKLGHEVEIIK